MVERLKERLSGFELDFSDRYLKDIVEMTTFEVQSFCNISSLDERLNDIVLERCVGKILFEKKCLNEIEYEDIVKEVTEGDFKVAFDTSLGLGKEQSFDRFIKALLEYGREELLYYRKIKW